MVESSTAIEVVASPMLPMLESSTIMEALPSPILRILHSRTRVKRKALDALPHNRQRDSNDAVARHPDIINLSTGK